MLGDLGNQLPLSTKNLSWTVTQADGHFVTARGGPFLFLQIYFADNICCCVSETGAVHDWMQERR